MRGLASASAHGLNLRGRGERVVVFVQVGVEPEQRSQVVGAQFADVQNQSPGVAICLFAIKLIAATAYGLSVRSLFGLDLNRPVPMPSRRWLPGARPSHKVFKAAWVCRCSSPGPGAASCGSIWPCSMVSPFCNDAVAKQAGQANHALDDGQVSGVVHHAVHKALVDLERVHGQAPQVRQ